MKMFKYWYLCFVACLLWTCIEEELPEHGYPVVTTSVVNITAEGVTFTGTIEFEHLDEITDHGFVWGNTGDDLSIENDLSVSLGTISSKEFSASVRSTLLKNYTYYARSFAKTKHKTVYGASIKFVSLGSEGPKINSLFPSEGGYGDTISVRGKNFSPKTETNIVTFEGVAAKVTHAADTLLKVVVPGALIKVSNKVQVSITNHITDSPQNFNVRTPSIEKATNPVFSICDTLIIEGQNLSSFGDKPTVTLNDLNAELVSVSANQIKVTYKWIRENPITIKISSNLFNITAPFQVTQVHPAITSIEPQTYAPGDTISVSIKDWPVCHKASVRLYDPYWNSYSVTVVEEKSNMIKFRAPATCIPSTKLWISGETFTITSPIELKPGLPKIFSVVPDHGKINDEVVITGEGFLEQYWWTDVTNFLDVTSASSKEIRGTVKEVWLESPTIDVTVTGCSGSATLPNGFTYASPEIFSITPSVVTRWDDVITIEGKNFSQIQNALEFNGEFVSNGLQSSMDGNQIVIPASLLISDPQIGMHVSGKIKVTTNAGLSVTSNDYLMIDYESVFRKEQDFPGYARGRATSITINGKAYVGLGSNSSSEYKDWWEFDGSSWTQKASFPEVAYNTARRAGSANGKGYFGLMEYGKKWWQYDPVSDQWERKADFPGVGRYSHFIFELNNKIFLGGGWSINGPLKDFWEYDPAADAWTEKQSLPDFVVFQGISFSHQGKGYTFRRVSTIWHTLVYDPGTDEWTINPISNPTMPPYFDDAELMKFDDYAILHLSRNPVPLLYKFDPQNNTLTRILSTEGARSSRPVAFVLNNRGYVGLGFINTYLIDFWSFDPALLEYEP